MKDRVVFFVSVKARYRILAVRYAYTSTMKLINELEFDFDLSGPKITAAAHGAIIENVQKVVLISDTSVTVDTGRHFVSVRGRDFIISEIWEGRMELEGKIEGIDFY